MYDGYIIRGWGLSYSQVSDTYIKILTEKLRNKIDLSLQYAPFHGDTNLPIAIRGWNFCGEIHLCVKIMKSDEYVMQNAW